MPKARSQEVIHKGNFAKTKPGPAGNLNCCLPVERVGLALLPLRVRTSHEKWQLSYQVNEACTLWDLNG